MFSQLYCSCFAQWGLNILYEVTHSLSLRQKNQANLEYVTGAKKLADGTDVFEHLQPNTPSAASSKGRNIDFNPENCRCFCHFFYFMQKSKIKIRKIAQAQSDYFLH